MNTFDLDTVGSHADEVTGEWLPIDWGIAAGSSLVAAAVVLILVFQLVSLARRAAVGLASWPVVRWIMAAVAIVALALTVLSIHGIQAALIKMGIDTWYGKLSAVIAFEVFLGLCAFLAYRQRMATDGGSGPYGLMVWVLASLMGAAGTWGGGSWLYFVFPVLAAVAWEFALHAQVTWTRRLDTDKAKTWWAGQKANWRAKLDLRNRRIKKLVAASLALTSPDTATANKAIVLQQKHMSALMTAGDWTAETKTEVVNRVRDLATASVILSPATLVIEGTVVGTKSGSNGGTKPGNNPELSSELSPELVAELKAIFEADNSGTIKGTINGNNGGNKAGTKAKAKRQPRGKRRSTKRGDKRAAVRHQWDAGLTDPAAIVEAVAVDGITVTTRYVRNLVATWNSETK